MWVGAWPGGSENTNVAHNHSPPQANFSEKWHILLIKEEIFVVRIE